MVECPAVLPLPAGEGRGEGERVAQGGRLAEATLPPSPHPLPQGRGETPTTLVIGLGNPILGDDGVGWRVAESLAAELHDPDVEVVCLALGGISLMERLSGYRRALIVDAVVGGAAPGTVHAMPVDEMRRVMPHHTASSHDLNLAAALDLGRELGVGLPDEVWIVGVEARPEFEFGEQLSPEVAAALPEALRRVHAWLAGA